MSRKLVHRVCLEGGCNNLLANSDGHDKCYFCLEPSHFVPKDEISCPACLNFKSSTYLRRLALRQNPVTDNPKMVLALKSRARAKRAASSSPTRVVGGLGRGRSLSSHLAHSSDVVSFGVPLAGKPQGDIVFDVGAQTASQLLHSESKVESLPVPLVASPARSSTGGKSAPLVSASSPVLSG
jgi:hypothetical protein